MKVSSSGPVETGHFTAACQFDQFQLYWRLIPETNPKSECKKTPISELSDESGLSGTFQLEEWIG